MAIEKPKAADYEQAAYDSKYQGQIDSTLGAITNREKFTYDPLKDANYQAMAKMYQKQGEQAAKNTLGNAAALNGGYGSSYAVTASQQARNDYNQQLASQVPALSEAAYNKYIGEQNLNLSALSALQAAEDSAYSRHRDSVADSQWKYGVDYQAYRDDTADSQWQKTYDRGVYESDRNFEYQKGRDAVADKQWAEEYALAKKGSSSSSGSSGGGSTYTVSSGDDIIKQLIEDAGGGDNQQGGNGKTKTASARAFRNAKAKASNEGKYTKKK